MEFDDEKSARRYDERIRSLIPGYDAFHLATAAKIMRKHPGEARILIVGAGTGAELLTFAKANPKWSFVVQDPAPAMLELCKMKCEEAGITDRVIFNDHDIIDERLRGMTFDAVSCMFVLHFVKTIKNKEIFLRILNSLLKPLASLYVADLMLPDVDDPYQRSDMTEYAVISGLPDDMRYDFAQRLEQRFDALEYGPYIEMIRRCGFEVKTSYFKALGFQAFDCVKTAQDR